LILLFFWRKGKNFAPEKREKKPKEENEVFEYHEIQSNELLCKISDVFS